METSSDIMLDCLRERSNDCGVLLDEFLRGEIIGKTARWTMVISVMDDLWDDIGLITISSYVPNRVPSTCRRDVAEFLVRANAKMLYGHFNMDFRCGEVTLKRSTYFGNSCPMRSLGRDLIGKSCEAMERYLPGMLSVIYGNESAEDACKACKEPLEYEPRDCAANDDEEVDLET